MENIATWFSANFSESVLKVGGIIIAVAFLIGAFFLKSFARGYMDIDKYRTDEGS
jgi:hypothetical protein